MVIQCFPRSPKCQKHTFAYSPKSCQYKGMEGSSKVRISMRYNFSKEHQIMIWFFSLYWRKEKYKEHIVAILVDLLIWNATIVSNNKYLSSKHSGVSRVKITYTIFSSNNLPYSSSRAWGMSKCKRVAKGIIPVLGNWLHFFR